ncbi:hypothetical protein BJP37_02550 [Moorena bouillonii PNG]|uniref:Uncharacterized protein n=1 Tax=Moorena bouillonii PNG TaxID=568701 RepID=A0A1U7MWJ3_9CYAN|nr:hypothetical protein BJP37_02550 [Moorena bouillonii PNG]
MPQMLFPFRVSMITILGGISNQQLAISNQQSAISNQQSAISNQQSVSSVSHSSSVAKADG